MKAKRCKYGHKVAHKQNIIVRTIDNFKAINWDKLGVLSALAAFFIYAIYMRVIG